MEKKMEEKGHVYQASLKSNRINFIVLRLENNPYGLHGLALPFVAAASGSRLS